MTQVDRTDGREQRIRIAMTGDIETLGDTLGVVHERTDGLRLGVLLAAGASSRMGQPKALIKGPEGRSFLERLLEVMLSGGCDAVLVVVGCHAAQIAEQLPHGALLVHNADWHRGQFTSVRRGLSAALQLAPRRIALHLIDQPLIEPSDVRAILSREAETAALAIAMHQNMPGHPLSFTPELARSIALDDTATSLRDALDRHAVSQKFFEGTAGCIRGANTPEELRELLSGGVPPVFRTRGGLS